MNLGAHPGSQKREPLEGISKMITIKRKIYPANVSMVKFVHKDMIQSQW